VSTSWAEIRAKHNARIVRIRSASEEIGLASSRRFVAVRHEGMLLRIVLTTADEAEEYEHKGWKIRAHDTEDRARASFERIERLLVAGAMAVTATKDGVVALVP